MKSKHLSKADVIKKLNASEDKIEKWCRSGRLHPQTQLNGRLIFKREEIETLQRQLGKGQPRQLTQKQEEAGKARAGEGVATRPRPRLLIVMKNLAIVKRLLPTFEQFLKSYDLKIIKCQQHETENLIELVINAYHYKQVRQVANLAQDFLGTAIISIETRY